MTPLTAIEPLHVRPSHRWLLWTLALAVVLVLHFLAGVWVIRATRIADTHEGASHVPVQVALLKPQAVTDASARHPQATQDATAPSQRPPAPSTSTESQADTGAGNHSALQAHFGAPSRAPAQTAPRRPPDTAHATHATHATRAANQAKPTPSASTSPTKTARTSRSSSEDRPRDERSTEHAPDAQASTPSAASSSTVDASASTAASHASIASTPSVASAASSPADANASASATSATATNDHDMSSGAASGSVPGIAAHAANASKGEKFSLPPSSDLRYESFYNGMQNPTGTIHWATDGSTYQMIVSIPLPFVGTYSYISEGRIDAYGLSPTRYTEQHGRRGTDVTTFDRDVPDGKPHVSFTRTPANVDLPAGAQDRFSMFMQLSSLVRGNPSRFTPGVTREFFVLDNDSGELWPIETVGDETVHTNMGFVPARHFTRLPRHEGDRRKVDVWLAPSLGWLPIRFLQTEPDGTQIELRFAGSTLHDDAHEPSAQENENAPAPSDASSAPDATPSESDTSRDATHR
ncbi:DUF3108 domain-containing protein [Pararobbsia alpina]|uniref:DUF3108 domain-containing protein n=1 Tax=Pararobbsia alpina TaxID=621374 RepID=UPI0039A50CEE